MLYNCNVDNICVIASGISTCILCGESFGFFTRQRNLLCADCHRAVCTKCGVESTAAGGKETVWLCKLCSETREMWKKSGAWFFKELPKADPGPTDGVLHNRGRRFTVFKPAGTDVNKIRESDNDLEESSGDEAGGGALDMRRPAKKPILEEERSAGGGGEMTRPTSMPVR